jgi:hypothetical protein
MEHAEFFCFGAFASLDVPEKLGKVYQLGVKARIEP